MLNLITWHKSKLLYLFIAITVAILTTGFLRLQLLTGLPETDGGEYTFASQYIYYALINGEPLRGMPLFLYQLMTSWVYGLEVNQYIFLRVLDGLVAVVASIILFKVILKESGSTLFTVILATILLIFLNDTLYIGYGYKNSIWASYLPLFSALLIWQNSTKEDKYSFYLIGGLVSLGVLLREAFLPFFLLAAIAILISYGWRTLFKYLISSAVLGFSVLGLMLMLRGWDLLDLINAYLGIAMTYGSWQSAVLPNITGLIKNNWFIFVTTSASIIYLINLHFSNNKLVSMNRIYFWLTVALLPLIEPIMKIGFPYHFSTCLLGLAGLSAMGWKYLNNQESERMKKSSMIVIGLMSLIVILPIVNKKIVQNDHLFSLTDLVVWSTNEVFRSITMVERSQYLITAAKIYGLSREDSTLVTSGIMGVMYPLTKLLPPTFELNDLNRLYVKLNYDEVKLLKIIEEYRPTLIMTSGLSWGYEQSLPNIIEKTNLYNKVAIVPGNPKLIYGWKFEKPGIIYRLKDFE